MKVRGSFALSILVLAVVLIGCSRADPSIIADSTGQDTPAGGAPATVPVAADASGALKYQQTELSGPADAPFTVNFDNPAALEHNWVMVEPGQEQAVAQAAQGAGGNPAGLPGVIAGGAPIATASEAVQVPATAAGTYPYICTVPGHYAAGMAGTITLGAATAAGEGTGGETAASAGASPAASAGAAAGGGTNEGVGSGLTVEADPSGQLKYQETTLEAKAGAEFTVNFANQAPVQHNWVLVEPGQEQAVATASASKNGDPSGIAGVISGGKPIAGSSETLKVPPQEPGTYPYICTVPGHYAAGMKGELTVTP